jgi:hypothetical protein
MMRGKMIPFSVGSYTMEPDITILMFFVSRILVEILKRKKVLRRKSVENRSVSLYTHELHSYVEPEKTNSCL